MNVYRLSAEADRDIEDILRFTVDRWGWRQAQRYGSDLHIAFTSLAHHPELGRRIDHIRAGYRRLEHGSHVIYYVTGDEHVLIVRVLHRRMRPAGRL